MMTPPLSIWARPFLVVQVDVSGLMSWWFLGFYSASLPIADPGVMPVRVLEPYAPAGLSHEHLDHSSSASVLLKVRLGCRPAAIEARSLTEGRRLRSVRGSLCGVRRGGAQPLGGQVDAPDPRLFRRPGSDARARRGGTGLGRDTHPG